MNSSNMTVSSTTTAALRPTPASSPIPVPRPAPLPRPSWSSRSNKTQSPTANETDAVKTGESSLQRENEHDDNEMDLPNVRHFVKEVPLIREKATVVFAGSSFIRKTM